MQLFEQLLHIIEPPAPLIIDLRFESTLLLLINLLHQLSHLIEVRLVRVRQFLIEYILLLPFKHCHLWLHLLVL